MKYILLTLLLTGCYTEKKATEQINKADEKFPKVVAKLARDKYPCTDLLTPDTALIFRDTLIYADCPDTARISSYETVITDTVNRVVTKTIRVPVTIRLPGTTITRWYEDSAKLKLADIEHNKLAKDNHKLQASNDILASKLKTKNKLMLLFVIIALALTAWILRKLFI